MSLARRPLSFLLAALLLTAATAAAQSVERLEIVDRSIAYHGGDALENSEIRLDLCSKSGCSQLKARVQGGLFDLEAAATVRESERWIRITNDTAEWTENGERQPIEDEQALRDWVMARIYFVFLPYRLNDPNVYKEDLGLEDWDGRPLRKVKVTFGRGSSTHSQDEYMYWFDPETARLEQFAYTYEINGGGLRFRKTTSHRSIGEIRFFDQENYGEEGPDLSVDLVTPEYVDGLRHVSTIRLDRIQVGRL